MPHNVLEFHNEPGVDEPSTPDHQHPEIEVNPGMMKKHVCIGASDDPWDRDTPDPHDEAGHLRNDHHRRHVLEKQDPNRMSPILEDEDYNQCHHFEELISVGYPPADRDGSEEPEPPMQHSTQPRIFKGILRSPKKQLRTDDPSHLHGMEPNPNDPAISEPKPPKEYLHSDPWEDLEDPHVIGHLPKAVGISRSHDPNAAHHEFLLLDPVIEDEAFRQYDEMDDDGTNDPTTVEPIPPQPHHMHRPHPRQLHHNGDAASTIRRQQLDVCSKI